MSKRHHDHHNHHDHHDHHYRPPLLHRNAHFSTIIPNRLRPVAFTGFVRQRIETEDDDFFLVDFHYQGANSVAILAHGLEGSSQSTYMLGMARHLNALGMDIAAMNHRSCGGNPNQLASSYHSGKTDDLHLLVSRLSQRYEHVYMIGFSLGGSMVLKLAGEWGSDAPRSVRAVIGVSVPCDLAGSAKRLQHWQNRIYLTRFLRQLKRKALQKAKQFPEAMLDEPAIRSASSFQAFDDAYTAPIHGFGTAERYYAECSSKRFLASIEVPTLIINAENDSFLSRECFPREEVAKNPYVEMLTPTHGGHVGFALDHAMRQPFWHELRVADFIAATRSGNR